ncbi:MAG: pantoate--beta-alanine ligase [Gemmataceae bacterium]
MNVTQTIEQTRQAVGSVRTQGRSVGFVPTMGALHQGHLSLFAAARAEADYVVASIFVNPTQFGPAEDLDKYPRTLEQDLEGCEKQGVDLVFTPTPELMYPRGFRTYVEVHDMQNALCGKSRPTHFRGVTTVVLKLFQIVQPDFAYFGQKDAQQARILEQMTQDLNVPVTLRVCPIVREPDGLAMSSRNRYLTPDQRQRATILHKSLQQVLEKVASGERDARNLEAFLQSRIENTEDVNLDYASVVDYSTLEPLDVLRGRVVIAVAAYFGRTRLIDNEILSIDP